MFWASRARALLAAPTQEGPASRPWSEAVPAGPPRPLRQPQAAPSPAQESGPSARAALAEAGRRTAAADAAVAFPAAISPWTTAAGSSAGGSLSHCWQDLDIGKKTWKMNSPLGTQLQPILLWRECASVCPVALSHDSCLFQSAGSRICCSELFQRAKPMASILCFNKTLLKNASGTLISGPWLAIQYDCSNAVVAQNSKMLLCLGLVWRILMSWKGITKPKRNIFELFGCRMMSSTHLNLEAQNQTKPSALNLCWTSKYCRSSDRGQSLGLGHDWHD